MVRCVQEQAAFPSDTATVLPAAAASFALDKRLTSPVLRPGQRVLTGMAYTCTVTVIVLGRLIV